MNPGNRNGATGMLCQQIGRKHPLNNPIDLINYNMEYCYIRDREAHPVCHQQVSVILSILAISVLVFDVSSVVHSDSQDQ